MVAFFFRTNIGLERDLPLLLLPTLLLRNLINGGGNFSVRPGLDMGFVDSFIFLFFLSALRLKSYLISLFFSPRCCVCFLSSYVFGYWCGLLFLSVCFCVCVCAKILFFYLCTDGWMIHCSDFIYIFRGCSSRLLAKVLFGMVGSRQLLLFYLNYSYWEDLVVVYVIRQLNKKSDACVE
jgi:hypothetical protein